MSHKSDMILISIHPEHIDSIVSGNKRFEYRKKVPSEAKWLAFYATTPIKKIIGFSKIERIISDSPQLLWRKTRGSSGISYTFFNKYFQGCKTAYAIQLSDIKKFEKPISLSNPCLQLSAPQSYSFLSHDKAQWLRNNSFHSIDKRCLLFIGGIHGSGKTFLSNRYLTTYAYKNYSASDLIRKNGADIRKDKKVKDIQSNQNSLLIGLQDIENKYTRIALDGHFCLLNKNLEIEKIPLRTFKDINISLIIVANPPKEIINERNSDRIYFKDNNIDIEKFLKIENAYAHEVASKLKIPILNIDTTKIEKRNIRKIDNFISNYFK